MASGENRAFQRTMEANLEKIAWRRVPCTCIISMGGRPDAPLEVVDHLGGGSGSKRSPEGGSCASKMKPVSEKIARRAIGAPSTVKLRGCERSEQQNVVFSAHLWRQKSKKSPETCAPRGPASSLRGSPRPPPGGGGSSQGGVWTPPWR